MNLLLPVFSSRGMGTLFLLAAMLCSIELHANDIFSNHLKDNYVTDCSDGDVQPPTASNPATIVAECIAPLPDPEVVTDESDDCPGLITVAFVNDVSDNLACPETITRTYSITDAAGNSIFVTQNIILHDLTDPVITCPPNITVEYGSDTHPNSTGFATSIDNCNPNEDVLFLDNVISGTCPVLSIIQRTWASVDDCGNTAICIQNVSVADAAPPVISCPADVTIEWGESILPEDTGFATATDIADQDVDITHSDNIVNTGTCPIVRIVERTWTATDDCGNTATCLQIISGTDASMPVINCPADLDIEWGESDQPSETGQATATDNADLNVDIGFNDNVIITGNCPAVNIIERTWTATDDCGNISTCLQVININDTTVPEISCPTSPAGPLVIAETEPNDVSQDPGTVILTSESIFSGSIGPILSDQVDHWVIQDGLSGMVSLQFISSAHPVTIAALTCFADQARTIEVNTQSILPFDLPITVNLNANLFYSVLVQNPLANGNPYELHISGSAFPSIPGSTVLECPSGFNTTAVGPNTPQDIIIDPSVTGIPVAMDNGGSVNVSYQDILVGPNPANCPEVLLVERTWTATDQCGLTSSCVENFIFTDTTDPVLTCPPDISVSWGSDDQPPATGSPTVTDNCDANVDMVFSDNLISLTGCPVIETIERTWVAGDDCGNATNCMQIISITDLEDPAIICPPDVTIECGDDDQPNSTGWATATDNYDPNVIIAFADEIILTGTCPDVQIIERLWSATDNCANRAECLQIIYVRDLTSPVITCPADITLECGESIDPSNSGMATAIDGCSVQQIDFTDEFNAGCGNTSIITRTWTATDDCGNSASCTQIITLEDATPPTINCPQGVSIECGDPLDPASTGIATGVDNCGTVQLDFVDSLIPNCGQAGLLSRTWTAVDDCGNAADCIQVITITDTTAPSINCPQALTIECGTSTDPSATGEPTGTDNCGAPQFNFTDSFAPGCGLTSVITRTWTASDDCGNTSTSCTQTITLEDNTVPELGCPASITIECGSSSAPGITGNPTVTDACGSTLLNFSDSSTPGCGFTEMITRTWTASDDCGNSTSCQQVITVADSTPPIVICPSNITIECGENIEPVNTGSATATDICGSVTLGYIDVPGPGSCGLTQIIFRSWFAADDCGNSAQCVQVITIVDTTPPTLNCPADISVDCGSSSDPSETGEPTGMDNCGSLQFDFTDSIVSNCGMTSTITRTWSATDGCGNNSPTCEQTITITDPTPPDLSCPPNVSIECGSSSDPSITGTPTANDACGSTSLNFSDNATSNCGLTVVITRTWIATDDCGNSASCQQIITVVDTTPPVINCPPDITIECGESTGSSNTGIPASNDDCGSVILGFSDASEPSCGTSEIITRTWFAADDCGNVAQCVQIITIEDNTPPIVNCPGGAVVECGTSSDPAETGQPSGMDNCGSVQYDFTDSFVSGCGMTSTITRTWSATDDCGNSASCQQLITVEDTTPPAMNCPPDITIECGESTGSSNTGTPASNDSCGSVILGFSDASEPGCGATEIITRTWFALDDCGNVAQCVQVITVEDNTPLVINCPTDAIVECGTSSAPSETGLPTGMDNCGSVQYDFTDSFVSGCGFTSTITRTWSATDDCGNSASCQQLITVVDTTPPNMNCPPDITLECGESTGSSNTGTPTSNDSCGSVILGFVDASEPGCGATEIITRTWFALDDCGNVAQCEQVITIGDTTPPEVACQDITVTMNSAGAVVIDIQDIELSSSDNCGAVSFSLSQSQFNCDELGDNLVTLTATDGCGLTGNCTAIVTVINPNPIIASAVITNQSGPAIADGGIDLSVSGGFPGYQYLWSDGSTTEDIDNLASDDYYVTISDTAGCSLVDTFFVGQGVLVPIEYCLTAYLQVLFDPFAISPTPPLRTTLNDLDLLPLVQPFSINPWFYFGGEAFASQADIPDNVADWMLLRIRSGSDPSQIIAQEAVTILSDGTITSVDGSLPTFFLDPAQGYWVEIDQHNHLPISSPLPLFADPVLGQVCHDFTLGIDQAYNDSQIGGPPMAAESSLNGVVFCMIGGNALFFDTQIDINDLNQIFIHYLESQVYVPWDINQDGAVDINDINFIFTVYGLTAHTPY